MGLIAGGLALGAAATIGGAYMSSQATGDAASKASKSQKDANQNNWNMYQESRGSKGSAALPLYLKEGGSLFEGKLGSDIVGGYENTNVPLDRFQIAEGKLTGAQDRATQFTNDIFNGGITSRLLKEAQPVENARVSSSMDALNKTLAAIDAAQAGKGFSGDSYGNRLLRFSGRRAQGDVGVQNLAEDQQIRNYGDVTLPMNNLSLPASMADQAGRFEFMPENDYLRSVESRLGPLGFLKIGAGSPPTSQPLPTAPPNTMGATIAGVGGQVIGSGLNAYMANQSYNNNFTAANGYSPATSSAVASSIEAGPVSAPVTAGAF